MKNNKSILALFLIMLSLVSNAQIGIGTNSPDASALLDLTSTTKGLLLPRMTTAEKLLLINPAIGLTVFNTSSGQIESNKGDGNGGALWTGFTTSGVTAPVGTNTTQLATTEFVMNNSDKYNAVSGVGAIATTSTSDTVVTGMTISPPAGTYFVNFNSQFNFTSATTTIPGVEVSTNQTATDLQAAYNQLNLLSVTNSAHAAVFGNGETLTAGVYSIGAAASMAGILTLDGQNNPDAKFVFKIGAAFNTGAGTTVLLTNGASACNVFWVVEAAVGLGANTKIKGTLISHGAALAAGAGCIIEGRLLSTSGALTSDNLTLTIPQNCNFINLGVAARFGLFTTDGAIANTAISTITGDVGTNSIGPISGLTTPSVVNGTIFPPGGSILITPEITAPTSSIVGFGIYQNGVLITNSYRTRTSLVNPAEISLQAIATVAAGQSIDVRWKTNTGILTLDNRILTLINVR
jgi:hypothetical protein